jgi:hypothetical protein
MKKTCKERYWGCTEARCTWSKCLHSRWWKGIKTSILRERILQIERDGGRERGCDKKKLDVYDLEFIL